MINPLLLLGCADDLIGDWVNPSSNCKKYNNTIDLSVDDGDIALLERECDNNTCLEVDEELGSLNPEGQIFKILSEGDYFHYAIPPGQQLNFKRDIENFSGYWTFKMGITTIECTDMQVVNTSYDPWFEGDVEMDLLASLDITVSGSNEKECLDIPFGLSMTTDVDSEEFGGTTLGCDGGCEASGFHGVGLFSVDDLEGIDCLEEPLRYTDAPLVGLRLGFNILEFPPDPDVEEIP